MNHLQQLYDELSAILVKTPKDFREDEIRKFCEKHPEIPYGTAKRKRFNPKTLTPLPFEGTRP